MNKKEHLKWWDNNLSNRNEEFSNWLKYSDESSRKFIFDMALKNNIIDVLECGPGTFIDYNCFFKTSNNNYSAIDITDSIVENGKNNGIDIVLSSIEDINKTSNSYDLVYCRHVLEHQDNFEKSLDEMIRVSRKYVVVVFWILSEGDGVIKFDEVEKLFHNSYSKKEIESFLLSKSLKFNWHYLDNDILLKIEK